MNGDGKRDLLSGSYSRHDPDMAGLFQVLFGEADGSFRPPEVLCGTDGEPLIVTAPAGDKHEIDKICTRPFAVDLNGDGKLDIVSGNFTGTFAFFAGEGKGRFAPTSTLLAADGKPLRVDAHSDPCLVDWDGDGDHDLVSGSSAGGVFLFVNGGSKTAPAFGARQTLLAPRGHHADQPMGDAHLTQPQAATRVWVDDVDGDDKLDLLIGDTVRLCFPADGVDEATAKQRLAEWNAKQSQLLASQGNGAATADRPKFQDAYAALQKERETFVRDEPTGFVWLLRQK